MEKFPEPNSLDSMEGVPYQPSEQFVPNSTEKRSESEDVLNGKNESPEKVIKPASIDLSEQAQLDKLRSELGISPEGNKKINNDEVSSVETQTKIHEANLDQIRESFSRLSSSIGELEETLVSQGFTHIRMDADNLKGICAEGIDLTKIQAFLISFLANLRREFMPKSDHEKLSLTPHNFLIIIDSLDSLKGKIIGVRKQIDSLYIGEQTSQKEISETMRVILLTISRKIISLSDARDALIRLLKR